MRQLASILVALITIPCFAASDATGRVVDATGHAIPNAHVYVYTAHPKQGPSAICPSCYRDCGKHEAANKDGEFRIAALDDTLEFTLLAVAPGFRPAYVNDIDPGKQPVRIALMQRSAATEILIRGIVVDRDGKPVVGAAVEPRGYQVGNRVGYGNLPGVENLSITDQTGAFELRIPDCDAKLDVRVRARNFAPSIARELRPSEFRRIIVSPGSTVYGHVMREGHAVSGVRIGLAQNYRASSDFLGAEEIATNDDGLFVLTSIGPNELYDVGPAMSTTPWPDEQKSRRVVSGAEGTSVDAGVFEIDTRKP